MKDPVSPKQQLINDRQRPGQGPPSHYVYPTPALSGSIPAEGLFEWFFAAVQHAGHAVLITDEAQKILFWNHGAAAIFGYQAEEIVGRPVNLILSQSMRGQWEDLGRSMIGDSARPSRYFVTRGRRKDGTEFPFETSLSLTTQDQALFFTAIMHEVADQEAAARQIQERTEDLDLINKLNDARNRGESFRAILTILAVESGRMFSSEGASIFLLSDDQKYLTMQRTDNKSESTHRVEKIIGKSLDRLEIKAALAPGSLVSKVLEEGKPQIVEDPVTIRGLLGELTDNPFLKKLVPRVYKILSMNHVMIVPLVSRQQMIGVMTISSVNPFPASALTRFTNISEQITVIVSHKQAEDALEESEARYRGIIETSPDAIVVADLRGHIQLANQRAVDLFGYEAAADAIGLNFVDFVKANERPRALLDMGKVQRHESLRHVEYTCVKKDGSLFPSEVSASLVTNAGGQPRFLMAIIRDITERLQSQTALEESEALYRSLVETSPDAIAVTNPDGRILLANIKAAQLYGYDSADELTGLNALAAVAGRDRKRMRQHVRQALNNNVASNFELMSTKKDGSHFPAEISISTVRDAQGGPQAVISIVRDVTEREKIAQEKQRSMNQLRRAMEGTVKAIALTVESRDPYTAGHQQRVSSLARAIAQQMGLSRTQVDGIRMAGTIHDLGKIHIPSEILSRPGKLSEMEMEFIRTHSQAGFEILSQIEFPWPVARIVQQHHERMDGSGYPGKLSGEDILPEARIIAVADVVEAMASHRPYRAALGIDIALQEINDHKGTLYDAVVAEACITLFREKGFTFS